MTFQPTGMSTLMASLTRILHSTGLQLVIVAAALFASLAPAQELGARPDRLLVLPFQVSGKPPLHRFAESELPEQTMIAALFLSRLIRDYDATSFKPRGQTTETLQGINQNSAENQLPSLCSDPRISHVLGGTLQFTGSQELTASVFTASCISRAILYRHTASGSVNDLQTLLRQSIFRTTPFLAENRAYTRLQNFEGSKNTNIHIVIDLSGSMELTLPFIKRALLSIEPAQGRNISITTIRPSGQAEHIESFSDQAFYRTTVQNLHASGAANEAAIINGLRSLPAGSGKILFFTDTSFSDKAMIQLSEIFSNFKRTGIQLSLFAGYASDPGFLERATRFGKVANLTSPVFGRRGGFVTGESHFFVRKDSSFFLCQGSAGDDIASGRLQTKSCEPFPAHRYTKAELSLDQIVQSYGERNRLKVSDIGPVYSDLEFRIADVVTDKLGSRAPYRILVENQGRAFWIGLNSAADYRMLAAKKGQSPYIGLHLKQTAAGIENIPAKVYVLSDAETPFLFLLEYEHLLKINPKYLNPLDVWFFHAQIRDDRHD